MIEIEHLLFVCTWLIVYLILQLCTWLILRVYLSPPLALPASFAVSLLCSCLFSWYLAWFGFSPIYTLGVFLLLTGIVLATVQKAQIGILSDLSEGKWYYILFFIVLFTMLVARMLAPNVSTYTVANFADYAFFNSIMQTPIVPPLDPWFAGGTLEVYYYLGHWCFATLGIIAQVPSWILYQLVLPTVFSVAAVQLYGIGKLLLKKFSLLPVILLFIVNPAFIYWYVYIARGHLSFHLLEKSVFVIPGTNNEFPLSIFLSGTAHAHAMAIFNQTFFILMIAYLFTQWQKLINSERFVCAILAGISLGTMTGMNPWDAFSYVPLFLLVAIVIWYQTHSRKDKEEWSGVGTWLSRTLDHLHNDVSDVLQKRTEISSSSATILYLWILVPVVAFLSYAPFLLMMVSTNGGSVQGIGIVYSKTTPPEFFLVFGWFLFLHVCTLWPEIKKQPKLLLIVIPFIIVGYPLIGIIFVLLAYLIARHEGISDLLFCCGLLVVLFCELVYIMEAATSGTPLYRMNTVFKLYFSVWFLLGVGALCSASIRVEQFMDQIRHKNKRIIIEEYTTKLVIVGVLALILAVPFLNKEITAPQPYEQIQGLDPFAWMQKWHPDDYSATIYLHELPGEHVLVEAEGPHGQYFARISTVTGIPTILGWVDYHEALFRSGEEWKLEERITDVRAIYEQPERASEIMGKYNADLLILGAVERERYQIPDDLDTYLTDLVPVFTAGETTIYQVIDPGFPKL